MNERDPVSIRYTVFVIGGLFVDVDEPGVGLLRFDAVSHDEMMLLITLASKSDYDTVVRVCEEVNGDGQE